MVEYLALYGYAVLEAGSGMEAAAVGEGDPDRWFESHRSGGGLRPNLDRRGQETFSIAVGTQSPRRGAALRSQSMMAPGSCSSPRMDSLGRDAEGVGCRGEGIAVGVLIDPADGRFSLVVLPGRGTGVTGRPSFFERSTPSELPFGGEDVRPRSASGGCGGRSVLALGGRMMGRATLGASIVGRAATGSIPRVSVPGTTNSIAVDS